jgi:CRP-like cAMP-binding protein
MISPELLRRYPHFAGLSEQQLKTLAMLGQQRTYKAGDVLAEEGRPATHLFVLMEGGVDVRYRLPDGGSVTVDTLGPGDLMGWSSLIEPYRLTATLVAREDSRVLTLDGAKVRQACEEDTGLGYHLACQVAKALRSRLQSTRLQLAGQS